MKSYEVRMRDSVVNTGLDCEFFPTRNEAQKAADMVNAEYPHASADVVESDEPVSLTFEEWNDAGW